jgi:CTP:phosphocholine cytidylyltransferase-like protein
MKQKYIEKGSRLYPLTENTPKCLTAVFIEPLHSLIQ